VHLLKYHATGFGSELPAWQFDVAKLGMGSKKKILRWLLVVVRYLSYLALSVVVQHYKVGKADERHSPVTLRKIVGGMESLNSIQHRLMLIYVDGFLYGRKSCGISRIPNPHMMRGH
jgi:hypothetical protein